MSTHRPRLTRRSAARMLDRQADSTRDVSTLLAAASAPAAGDELAGEARALAQFRAATPLTPVTTAGGARPMTRSIRKLAAAPALALGVAGAVVASGGIALAASQGALHVPFTGHDNRSNHAPSAPASTNPGLTRTKAASPSAEDTASPSAHPTPKASPSPSLTGLCRAFQAGATHDGKTNPAFNALTAAAGGSQNISTYCVGLIGSPTPHPAASPTHPAKPTKAPKPTHPEPRQSEHPTPSGH